MRIKKVTLRGSGFKGLEVVYLREEEKGGRMFMNEIVEKRKHPIHLGLETMFKDLRVFLLEITGGLRGDEDKSDKDYVIGESEVVSLEWSDEWFMIGGERVVFLDKRYKIKTPKVDGGDEYKDFDVVMKMIEVIVEEVKEYLAGTKKVDDVEVAVRWVESGKSKEVTPDQLRGMSPERLKEFATKLLENNFGMVVMGDDAFVPDSEELEKAVEEGLKEEEVVIDMNTVGETSFVLDELPPVSKKKKEKVTVPLVIKESVTNAAPVKVISINDATPPQGDSIELNTPAF